MHLYADDIAVQVVSTVRNIVEHACDVLSELASTVEGIELRAAKRKMTVTCSNLKFARQVCRRIGVLGYRVVDALDVLGVEVASGRPIRYARFKIRIGKMKVRQARFRRMRKAGPLLGKFAKQAVPAALANGIGVHGAPPSLVHAMRRALRGAWYEPGKQGSAWLSTFLQGSGTPDPQVSA
eukprot:8100284-Pyramimonas_sp.AAC.1